jgi:hypothetical protein
MCKHLGDDSQRGPLLSRGVSLTTKRPTVKEDHTRTHDPINSMSKFVSNCPLDDLLPASIINSEGDVESRTIYFEQLPGPYVSLATKLWQFAASLRTLERCPSSLFTCQARPCTAEDAFVIINRCLCRYVQEKKIDEIFAVLLRFCFHLLLSEIRNEEEEDKILRVFSMLHTLLNSLEPLFRPSLNVTSETSLDFKLLREVYSQYFESLLSHFYNLDIRIYSSDIQRLLLEVLISGFRTLTSTLQASQNPSSLFDYVHRGLLPLHLSKYHSVRERLVVLFATLYAWLPPQLCVTALQSLLPLSLDEHWQVRAAVLNLILAACRRNDKFLQNTDICSEQLYIDIITIVLAKLQDIAEEVRSIAFVALEELTSLPLRKNTTVTEMIKCLVSPTTNEKKRLEIVSAITSILRTSFLTLEREQFKTLLSFHEDLWSSISTFIELLCREMNTNRLLFSSQNEFRSLFKEIGRHAEPILYAVIEDKLKEANSPQHSIWLVEEGATLTRQWTALAPLLNICFCILSGVEKCDNQHRLHKFVNFILSHYLEIPVFLTQMKEQEIFQPDLYKVNCVKKEYFFHAASGWWKNLHTLYAALFSSHPQSATHTSSNDQIEVATDTHNISDKEVDVHLSLCELRKKLIRVAVVYAIDDDIEWVNDDIRHSARELLKILIRDEFGYSLLEEFYTQQFSSLLNYYSLATSVERKARRSYALPPTMRNTKRSKLFSSSTDDRDHDDSDSDSDKNTDQNIPNIPRTHVLILRRKLLLHLIRHLTGNAWQRVDLSLIVRETLELLHDYNIDAKQMGIEATHHLFSHVPLRTLQPFYPNIADSLLKSLSCRESRILRNLLPCLIFVALSIDTYLKQTTTSSSAPDEECSLFEQRDGGPLILRYIKETRTQGNEVRSDTTHSKTIPRSIKDALLFVKGRNMNILNDVMDHIVYEFRYLNKSEHFKIYCQCLGPLFERMGIALVRHFKPLIPQLLLMLTMGDDELCTYVLKNIKIIVSYCWPRVPAHADEIFKALGTYFIESLNSKEAQRIHQHITEVITLLAKCVPHQLVEEWKAATEGISELSLIYNALTSVVCAKADDSLKAT